MKKIIFAFVLVLSVSGVASAATRVSGYTKSNGTYVKSYYKSDSDSFKSNNYSSKGNVNPYTGKKGTKKW